MNFFQAIFLGAVQGLTEFIPVSSSGHLVIFQSIFSDFYQEGVIFDVLLHLGTAFSVLVYFRKKITILFKMNLRYLVLGSLPAVFVGFFFSDYFENLFNDPKTVSIMLLLTGVLNLLTGRKKTGEKKITIANSLFIGVFQALAIIPGISRSGSTIFAGVISGLKKSNSAEFSFLLSIISISGAVFYQLLKYGVPIESEINLGYYLSGFFSAFIFGILGIRTVFSFIKKLNYDYFAFYCFFAGIAGILFF